MADLMRQFFDFFERALVLHDLYAFDARLGHGHAFHFFGGFGHVDHMAVLVDHLNRFEIMRTPDLKVIGIVRRRDFHEAGPESGIDHAIGDDGNRPSAGHLAVDTPSARHRHDHLAANRIGVRFVTGMHRHRYVGDDRSLK